MSEVERSVHTIWREVLSVPDELLHATFFELQGQSISAMRIVTRIEDELGIAVDVGELFDDPDMASFARAVAARAKEGAAP